MDNEFKMIPVFICKDEDIEFAAPLIQHEKPDTIMQYPSDMFSQPIAFSRECMDDIEFSSDNYMYKEYQMIPFHMRGSNVECLIIKASHSLFDKDKDVASNPEIELMYGMEAFVRETFSFDGPFAFMFTDLNEDANRQVFYALMNDYQRDGIDSTGLLSSAREGLLAQSINQHTETLRITLIHATREDMIAMQEQLNIIVEDTLSEDEVFESGLFCNANDSSLALKNVTSIDDVTPNTMILGIEAPDEDGTIRPKNVLDVNCIVYEADKELIGTYILDHFVDAYGIQFDIVYEEEQFGPHHLALAGFISSDGDTFE